MPPKWFVLLSVVMLTASIATGQSDSERIVSYHSDIVIEQDGWLTVTETIEVRSAGQKIKRGIYRDFPVRYAGRDLRRIIVPFEVLSVERDGRAEAYHTERKGKHERIYMGRKNVPLAPGVHTYRLTYRAGRLLGFFTDHDELYFNVTGNEWDFPIDSASAAVTLPEGATDATINREAYTGGKGQRGKDYTSSLDAVGRATFSTTRPLDLREGLTIVVTWPKGLVAEPTFKDDLAYFFSDNSMALAGLIGLVVVGTYFLVVWIAVGRDPPKGLIIPLFEPPDGLCPASLRYVLRMGFDKACFAASVIDLAVKKHLSIEEYDGDYSLAPNTDADESVLSPGEKTVAYRLFGRSGVILPVNNRNHPTFQEAITGLKRILAAEYKGRYFLANLKWFLPGMILSLLTLAAVALIGALVEGDAAVVFLCVWLTGWSAGTFFLVRQVIVAWRGASAGGSTSSALGGRLVLTLFAVPFCIAEVVVLTLLVYMASIWLPVALVLLGGLTGRFYHLLKQPTVAGRELMDRIEGFRMYMGTAEWDLHSAAHGPPETPELFEKYLPYAVALGVESVWADKFTDVLARAAAADAARGGYQPGWYRGAGWRTMGTAAFASSFGRSFSNALSSASTAPGSSRGAGGGGSSGGGGGGGGGGGW